MPLSMYDVTVPVLTRALGNLDALLVKGEEHATAQGLDLSELATARLAPDMFPLTGQVQSASDSAKFAVARLTGTEAPSFADTETTFEELHQRIANTLTFIASVDPAAFEGSETRAIVTRSRRGERHFIGQSYLLTFALPNFFFHVATAYDILRHKGVPVGKSDYLGAF
jgi:hypothetical protein